LGTAVDQENRVIGSKNTFAPDDTVYASIATSGGGSATLSVRWTNIPGGSVVHEERRTISSRKPGAFEVHCRPPEGWAVGRHALLFALDDDVHTREFKV